MVSGYYLGKAAEGEGAPILAYILGMLLSLFGLVVFINRVSLQSGFLVLLCATVFFMYNSGIITGSERIEEAFDRLRMVSLFALLVVVFVEVCVPLIIQFINWISRVLLDVFNWINNGNEVERYVFSIFALIVAVAAFSLLWKGIRYLIELEENTGG